MRVLYQERLDILVHHLTTSCGDIFHFDKPDAGMHLIAWLNDTTRKDTGLCQAIWDAGIDCLPVSMYCDTKEIDPGIMLGFACAPETKISQCVSTLYSAVKNHVTLQTVGLDQPGA